MTAHHIKLEKRPDGIAILSIDRAEKRNAMTYAMLAAFIGTVREVSADDSVRVLIVTGSGGTFCAGTDLADLATIPGETRGVRGGAGDHDVWWPLVACPCRSADVRKFPRVWTGVPEETSWSGPRQMVYRYWMSGKTNSGD